MANIEEMKERLENLKNEYLEIVKELEPLRENEIVKRFIELSNKESKASTIQDLWIWLLNVKCLPMCALKTCRPSCLAV